MWTVNYIRKYIGEFSDNSILRFEYSDATDLGRRYVDVIDETRKGRGEKIFYEMKSVENVPPEHFKEQFMKDLSNSDITDLSQIRWRFNGEKNPPNFREKMMDAIDQLPLIDKLAEKYFTGLEDASTTMLRQEIKNKFDNIFKLVF